MANVSPRRKKGAVSVGDGNNVTALDTASMQPGSVLVIDPSKPTGIGSATAGSLSYGTTLYVNSNTALVVSDGVTTVVVSPGTTEVTITLPALSSAENNRTIEVVFNPTSTSAYSIIVVPANPNTTTIYGDTSVVMDVPGMSLAFREAFTANAWNIV